MKKRSIFPFALLFFILIAGLITLRSNRKATTTPCKDPMEQCCKKKTPNPSSGDPIWEMMSRQFVSIAGRIN